jgi:hypothetical protein
MNIPNHISESLKAIFWVKILKFFDADQDPGIFLSLNPGSGMEKIRIRDKHPGSATLLLFKQALNFLAIRIIKKSCQL